MDRRCSYSLVTSSSLATFDFRCFLSSSFFVLPFAFESRVFFFFFFIEIFCYFFLFWYVWLLAFVFALYVPGAGPKGTYLTLTLTLYIRPSLFVFTIRGFGPNCRTIDIRFFFFFFYVFFFPSCLCSSLDAFLFFFLAILCSFCLCFWCFLFCCSICTYYRPKVNILLCILTRAPHECRHTPAPMFWVGQGSTSNCSIQYLVE